MIERLKLPKPFADPELWRTTLETGFRRYPRRLENYRKYEAAKRGERVGHLPIKLDIENVSRCNFHCTMCQVSEWEKYKRAEDMSFDDYKALLDSQEGLLEVKLQGMGEPLMGACYFDMIRYARDRSLWVRSTTNASLLHLKDNHKRVIDADICELQISIDGTTSSSYEKIRRGGQWKKVQQNCQLINQYCRDTNRRRTRMWTVLQVDNIHEIERFPACAAELGFERLTLSIDIGDWGQDHWTEVTEKLDVHDRISQQVAEHLIALGKSHNVEVTFWYVDERFDTASPSTLCQWPFERAYVSSDMRIVPCCKISNPDELELGDARNFTEAWNSEAYQEFRRVHLEGRIPKVCFSCYTRASVQAALQKEKVRS